MKLCNLEEMLLKHSCTAWSHVILSDVHALPSVEIFRVKNTIIQSNDMYIVGYAKL